MPIHALRPIEIVNASSFTPVGAPNIPLALDETVSDQDVSYATTPAGVAGSVGAVLVVRLQPHGIPDSGIINSVNLTVRARRVVGSVGQYTVIPILRVNTTDYDLTIGSTLSTQYQDFTVVVPINPATGQPWTVLEVRRVMGGMRVLVDTLPAPQVRITQVYAGLDFIAPTWTFIKSKWRAA